MGSLVFGARGRERFTTGYPTSPPASRRRQATTRTAVARAHTLVHAGALPYNRQDIGTNRSSYRLMANRSVIPAM